MPVFFDSETWQGDKSPCVVKWVDHAINRNALPSLSKKTGYLDFRLEVGQESLGGSSPIRTPLVLW